MQRKQQQEEGNIRRAVGEKKGREMKTEYREQAEKDYGLLVALFSLGFLPHMLSIH